MMLPRKCMPTGDAVFSVAAAERQLYSFQQQRRGSKVSKDVDLRVNILRIAH